MADLDPAVLQKVKIAPYGDFQHEIYKRGLEGERPQLPLTASGLEARARETLTPEAFGYVAGAAGAELTARANTDAFAKLEIVPRMLRDVSTRDLRTSLLGTEMSAPLLLAPVGVQSIVHPQAEL